MLLYFLCDMFSLHLSVFYCKYVIFFKMKPANKVLSIAILVEWSNIWCYLKTLRNPLLFHYEIKLK